MKNALRLTVLLSALLSAAAPRAQTPLPLPGSLTGALTNGQWAFYRLDVPATNAGFRVVLNSTGPGSAYLYLQTNAPPTNNAYLRVSYYGPLHTMVLTGDEATNGSHFIGVYLPASPRATNSFTLSAEGPAVTTLAWDTGTNAAGSQVFTNQSATGGDYYFKINPQSTTVGAWRTVLNVTSGEASLALTRWTSGGLPPGFNYRSNSNGSDGLVLPGNYYTPGEDWCILVSATPGAQWTLFSGEVFAHNLGPLAADDASSTNVVIGPEGCAFFKTTVPADALAWRLWLNGANQTLYVRKSFVPLPAYNAYELSQFRQMLVVPDYLAGGTFNGFYFVAVPGALGTTVALDSRRQPILDIPFNSTNASVAVTGFGYTTYRVSVPVQQIAWQVSVVPEAGDPNLVVRRDKVPNEFNQDACSAVPGNVTDSFTLVPPSLTDGIFYITVYGSGPHRFTLQNANPGITDIPYVGRITNTWDTGRAGWIYFRVPDINSQLGSLGWELALSGHVPGTQIALRRNAVPGLWRGCNSGGGGSHYDFLDADGCLQRPGHVADIWYVGIYSPIAALGGFTLTTRELIGVPVALEGGEWSVTNQPPGKWQFLRVDVPADTNLLGWDLRVVPLNGSVSWTVRRDVLPEITGTSYWYPNANTNWPTRNQWGAQGSLSGFYYDAAGRRLGEELMMIRGWPLEPGTYYVGLLNEGTGPASYSVRSRGMGAGYSIPLGTLDLNGSVTTNLPAGETAWYRVDLSTAVTNWMLRLTNASGESSLLHQSGHLPGSSFSPPWCWYCTGANPLWLSHQGEERFHSLAYFPPGILNTGVQYVAVVGQGENPHSYYLGSNSTTLTLASSAGAVPICDLGTVGPVDLVQSNALDHGDYTVYEFMVPTGVLSMELRLENKSGNPKATLLRGAGVPAPNYSDGPYYFSGSTYENSFSDLLTLANPVPGLRRVTAVASGTYGSSTSSNASYTLRVSAVAVVPLDLDGGTHSLSNQTPNTWRFFSVEVPSDANLLGWDVRLTPESGMVDWVVRRGTLPDAIGTSVWCPSGAPAWPTGNQWAGQTHLSGYYYDATGARLDEGLTMARGNPLEPGLYYLGVFNSGTTNARSTVRSRGIGAGYSIPVTPLDINGSLTTNLPAGEVSWHRLDVPAGQTNWTLRLNSSRGESALRFRRNFLPASAFGGGNWWRCYDYPLYLGYTGEDRYSQLAYDPPGTLSPGTYYVAAVSQGENPRSYYLGSNSTTLTLTSTAGAVPILDLGTVGAADLTRTNTLLHGDYQVYEFMVPTGVLSMELRLENKTGNPKATLLRDGGIPAPSYADGPYYFEGSTYHNSFSDLLTLANPAPGLRRVTVVASGTYGSSTYSNASYTLRVSAVAVVPLALDGGTQSVSNHAPNTWRFFSVEVPTNASLLGWDVRLTPESGIFNWVVRRGALPDAIGTSYGWCPSGATAWPTGTQWAGNYHLSGYYYDAVGGRLDEELTMARGNPLEAGLYYIGVLNTATTNASYTVRSRGLGSGYSIPVTPLDINGSLATNLPAGEIAWHRFDVPAGQTNWSLRLQSSAGESALRLRKNFLPASVGGGNSWICYDYPLYLGHAGEERYSQLAYSPPGTLTPGTYYVAVVSQGENPRSYYLGSNSTTLTLTSTAGAVPVQDLGMVGASDLARSDALAHGDYQVYEFMVPSGILSMELRLENKIGLPRASVLSGEAIPRPDYLYGPYYFEGGNYGTTFQDLLTLANPTPGLRRVTIVASDDYPGTAAPNASYMLRVRQHPIPQLNLDALLNTNGLPSAFSGALAQNQRAYFRVDVPAGVHGLPVLGWRLDLEETNGTPSVRVRKDRLPTDADYGSSATPWASRVAVIAPPLLTPGTWYGEVKGSAAGTIFNLRSSVVTLGTLERTAWVMPGAGQTNVEPGLAWPEFGDTGTNGVDLEQGRLHFYAVLVPTNNAGLLRTELQAISGNPDLYIRMTNAPTFTHCASGSTCAQYEPPLYDRSLGGPGTQYGNWVPLNGIAQTNLTPGVWMMAVHAAGGSNVRYRLRLAVGDIQDLPLEGGGFTGQLLAGGDWRYYRVQVPRTAPVNWLVTFAQQLGDVVMHLRDTAPPGDGRTVGYYGDQKDWATDYKNQWNIPRNGYDAPGTHTFAPPPLRPGHTYYLGFRGVSGNNRFSVSSATSGGTITVDGVLDFYSGFVTNVLPPFGKAEYRVDVPADAMRWKNRIVRADTVGAFIEQGTRATGTAYDHWRWGELDTALTGWPWLPGQSYWILLTNTSAIPQPVSLTMNGCNDATCDEDHDSLPDRWELNCFGNLAQTATGDPDLDGVNNFDEFREGTVPCDSNSFRARLTVNAAGGSVTVHPALSNYARGAVVTLTATPNPGFTFAEWSGSVTSSANPLMLTMDGHKSVTARFAYTNTPAGCPAPPSGLVSWWPMDGNTADLVGTNQPFSTNGLTFVPGVVGLGVSFGNSGYLEVAHSASLANQRFTISAWAMPEAPRVNNDSFGSVLIGRIIDGNTATVGIWWSGLDGRFRFGFGYIWSDLIASAHSFPTGQFHLVTATYDGQAFKLYVNGALEAQMNLVKTVNYGPGTSWYVGATAEVYRNIGYPRTWAGVIDDLAIFNRALTPAEIAAIHAAGSFCGVTVPQLSAPSRLPDGRFRFDLRGLAGYRYVIEGTSDLGGPSPWAPLATVTNTNGVLPFIDEADPGQPRRFYRARVAP